jgi:predicted lipoprotein with Yx(FWY)xxD motif
MAVMRKLLAPLVMVLVLVLVACGDDAEMPATGGAAMEQRDDAAMERNDDAAAKEKKDDAAAMEKEPKARGTRIVLGESEFGDMLFDAKRQAIYIFERDPKGRSTCYGECAEAWPPVFTDGEPVAGKGVKSSLLGTVKRRDGKEQVTYAGKPLYFYAHEGPGQVLCHNVNLNGGLWWVVGADGERRP